MRRSITVYEICACYVDRSCQAWLSFVYCGHYRLQNGYIIFHLQFCSVNRF